MKKILSYLLLVAITVTAQAQQKPDYVRSRSPQVITDRALKAQDILVLPHGSSRSVPGYVADTNKTSDIFHNTSERALYIGGVRYADTVKKIPLVLKGVPNGVATLDGGGKVPLAMLPANLLKYKGVWNPITNTPSLANGTGETGDVWEASADGIHNWGNRIDTLRQGDFEIYDGTHWQLSAGTNRVTSVNGYQGIVNLNTDDVHEAGNKYYTDDRVASYLGNKVIYNQFNAAQEASDIWIDGQLKTEHGDITTVGGFLRAAGMVLSQPSGYVNAQWQIGAHDFEMNFSGDDNLMSFEGSASVKFNQPASFYKIKSTYYANEDDDLVNLSYLKYNVLTLSGSNQVIQQTPSFPNGLGVVASATFSDGVFALTNNARFGIVAGSDIRWDAYPDMASGGITASFDNGSLKIYRSGIGSPYTDGSIYLSGRDILDDNGNYFLKASTSYTPADDTKVLKLTGTNQAITQIPNFVNGLNAGNSSSGPYVRVSNADIAWFSGSGPNRVSLQSQSTGSFNVLLPASAGTLATTNDITAFWAGASTGRVIYSDPSSGLPTSSSLFTYNGTSLGISSSGNPPLTATNTSSTYGAAITGRNNANGVANTAGLLVINNAGTAGRASGVILGFGAGSGQSASYGAILDNAANNAADNVIAGSNGGFLAERMRITNTGRVSFGSAMLASSAFYIGTAIRSSAVSGVGTGLHLNPTITASANNDALSGLYINPSFLTTGGIATLDNSSLVGGTGYADGTYNNIDLTGGVGLSAQATITVSGGSVTAVTLTAGGGSYAVGNTLSASASFDGAGSGSGFSINVSTITSYTGVNTYGIRSSIATATNRWNLYIDGAAPSYFAGSIGIGTSSPGYKVDVFGSVRIAASVSDSYANRQNSIIFNRSDNLTTFSNKITNSMSGTLGNTTMNFELANGATTWVNALTLYGTGSAVFGASVTSTQYRVSSLNTAPASATDTGTAGEIRITAGYIYVCSATNTWVRTPLTTF